MLPARSTNELLEAAQAQRALGWRSTLEHSGDRLVLRLSDRDGRALSGITVSASAQRPVGTEQDLNVLFQETAPGNYESQAILQPGIWNIDARANAPSGERYRQVFRLRVRQ